MLSLLYNRRVSSFLALSIISSLAFILGAVIINQSSKYKALQMERPLWYAQIMTTTTINY